MILRLLCLLATLAGLLAAGELDRERIWTGVNGNTLRGIFIRTLGDGKKVEIATSNGSILTIALDNLSKADRDLIENGSKAPAPRPADPSAPGQPAGAAGKFKPDPVFNRALIPLLDPEKLSLKHGWAINSMATFIMWWDESGWIEVPRGRDFEDKVDCVYDRLERFEGRNTSVPDVDDVLKGFANYFDSRFEDEASYRAHLEYDLSPARLAQLASGPNACLLFASANGYGPYFALLEAKPDGQLRLGMAGEAIDARMVPLPGQDRGSRSHYRFDYELPIPGGKTHRARRPDSEVLLRCRAYKLVVDDRSKLPKEFREEEHDIIIGASRPLIVFRPYLFAKKGEKAAPPPEPSFEFDEPRPPGKG